MAIAIRYFRCQIVDGYAKGVATYNDPYFVVIPTKEGGNTNLVKTKGGWSAPDSNGAKKAEQEEPNERRCWQFLRDHLAKLVNDEIGRVRAGRRQTQPTQDDRPG